ncbi:isochorismatase family protein [Clostridium sp. D2Q-11]|uniref:Isochorismatase family protein n=1 Tax=Anaeromonas frigoriresistens TaxID=2683708 RepID=A0A942UUG7_9FIRM|nr:isochorismatase family protein [Anaeromonas frigoriresistens]MBS4538813.1 isochorismatase family protein [Anaeromonas frigoriresistens]
MLFIIDMQNDFIDQERGKMAVKGSDKLVKGILEKVKEYEEKNDIIFYTLDIHEDMESDRWKKEEREWGQELYPPLKEKLENHIPLKKHYHGIPPKDFQEFRGKYGTDEKYLKKLSLLV